MIPWRLVAFILVMALVLGFVAFNLDNYCDVSIAFVTIQAVPVVVTILVSFVAGLLSSLFFVVHRNRKAAAGPKGTPHVRRGGKPAATAADASGEATVGATKGAESEGTATGTGDATKA